MITNEIGLNAGKVWNLLNEQGNHSLSILKKKLNFSERDIYMAIRKLEQENKINLFANGEEWLLSLRN